jgi:hypothetical protein
MNAGNLITDGEMWITTGESDLQDADRLGNICRVTSVALFLPFRKKIRASKKEVRLQKRNYGEMPKRL